MNAMAPIIRKATRKKAKLRLALIGPTGSGKTMSALRLGFGIGGKVGVIDTENGSADLYADLGDYDVITLEKPYTVQKYRDAISAFEQAGYTTIIVDSLSHAWSGSGGLLDKQGMLESTGKAKNSFAAWREITPEQNALIETLLSSPAHIIATMRVKTEYVLEPDHRGKMVPVKKGMQPVQRDGVEYEFTVVMDVDAGHRASASKDRTTIFSGWHDTITEDTGRKLRDWLDSGEEPAAPMLSTPTSPPWAGMAWPICDRKGNCIDLKTADEWHKEMRKRVSAVQMHAKLSDDAKRETVRQMWDANKDAFADLAERAEDDVLEIEALLRVASEPPTSVDDDVFPGDLPSRSEELEAVPAK